MNRVSKGERVGQAILRKAAGLSEYQRSEAEAYGWLNSAVPSLRVSFGPAEPQMAAAADLGDPRSAALAVLLEHQRQLLPDADPRTGAAAVLGQYSYFLGLAAAAPYLRAGLIADVSAGNLAFRLEEPDEGGNSAWRRYHLRLHVQGPLSPPIASYPADDRRHAGRVLLQGMLEHHLQPLIMALKDVTGFGRQPQWRIAGDQIAAGFLEIGKRLGDPAMAASEALAILKQPRSLFRNRQLNFLTLAVPSGKTPDAPVIEDTFRLRGGCCRLYRMEGGTLCPTCVLAEPRWQRDELKRFMLERSRGQHSG